MRYPLVLLCGVLFISHASAWGAGAEYKIVVQAEGGLIANERGPIADADSQAAKAVLMDGDNEVSTIYLNDIFMSFTGNSVLGRNAGLEPATTDFKGDVVSEARGYAIAFGRSMVVDDPESDAYYPARIEYAFVQDDGRLLIRARGIFDYISDGMGCPGDVCPAFIPARHINSAFAEVPGQPEKVQFRRSYTAPVKELLLAMLSDSADIGLPRYRDRNPYFAPESFFAYIDSLEGQRMAWKAALRSEAPIKYIETAPPAADAINFIDVME